MSDDDIRKRIYDDQRDQIEQDMAPFGFVSDGITEETSFVDSSETDGILMNMVICHTCGNGSNGHKR